MDDCRWNAERFNEWGPKVKAAGMQFGYHNHTMEFATIDGLIPMKELLRLTDPELVTFELDCGWVTVGGGDPVGYLLEYAKLHAPRQGFQADFAASIGT
jgi:sugar phosphate isomerase/epimerase